MRLPHQRTDAFGGLMLLASMAKAQRLAFAPAFSEQTEGSCEGYRWLHAWTAARGRGGTGQTFTQRFVEELLAMFDETRLPSLSLAVALDDPAALPKAGVWGNSLALVNLKRAELHQALGLARDTWHTALQERGHSIKCLLERRPELATRARTSMLVSSIGRLERLEWAPALDPRSLMMVPTPGRSDLATIVLWSSGGFQALTVAAVSEHPLLERYADLLDAWRGLI
jgi:hypothetical protein